MFGRKATAEDVLKLFSTLTDEEKAKVLDGVKPKTEDETQIAEAEENMEEKGEENGTKDQTAQDIEDESVGEQEKLDGNETSESAKDVIDESEGAEAADETAEQPVADDDGQSAENEKEVLAKLAERLGAVESALKEFGELKSRMEEFTAKQAENFGYKGKPFGAKKDMQDMSADELKDHILQGN